MDPRRECEITVFYTGIYMVFTVMVDAFTEDLGYTLDRFIKTGLLEKIQSRWPETPRAIYLDLCDEYWTTEGQRVDKSFVDSRSENVITTRVLGLIAEVYMFIRKEHAPEGQGEIMRREHREGEILRMAKFRAELKEETTKKED